MRGELPAQPTRAEYLPFRRQALTLISNKKQQAEFRDGTLIDPYVLVGQERSVELVLQIMGSFIVHQQPS